MEWQDVTLTDVGVFMFKIFLLFIIIFLALLVHELGHLIMARLFKVHVKAFSIGRGRTLFECTCPQKTRWHWKIIPFGAHVDISGMNKRAYWQRALIIAGGPLINLTLPFILFIGFYLLAGQPSGPPVIVGIEKGFAAEKAGLKPGDEFLAVDDVPVFNMQQIWAKAYEGELIERRYKIRRGKKEFDIKMTPSWSEYIDEEGIDRANARFGIFWTHAPFKLKAITSVNGRDTDKNPDLARQLLIENFDKPARVGIKAFDKNSYIYDVIVPSSSNPLINEKQSKEHKIVFLGTWRGNFYLHQSAGSQIRDAVVYAARRIGKVASLPLQIFPIDPDDVRDEYAVGDESSKVRNGLYYFIHNLALASIFFGLLNLLPLPYLDGSHILLQGIESVRGRPMTRKGKAWLFVISFLGLYGAVLLANSDNLPRYIDSRLKKVHEFMTEKKDKKHDRAEIHQRP